MGGRAQQGCPLALGALALWWQGGSSPPGLGLRKKRSELLAGTFRALSGCVAAAGCCLAAKLAGKLRLLQVLGLVGSALGCMLGTRCWLGVLEMVGSRAAGHWPLSRWLPGLEKGGRKRGHGRKELWGGERDVGEGRE